MKLPQAILDLLFRARLRLRAEPRQADAQSLDAIEKSLAYRFRDRGLLQLALTHKSFVTTDNATTPANWLICNERLEFLGDAVLNCLVTEYLYKKHPELDEGHLSKMKSLLVSRKILGDVASEMQLGTYLILGYSESKTGGHTRMSLQSNAFEAVIGALYLDGGMPAAQQILKRTLFPRVDEFINDEENVNYKSSILEMAQRDGFGVPRYSVIAATGPDHAKEFKIRIEINGVPLGEGSGPNKKLAEQRAAYNATMKYDKEQIASLTRRS